MAERLFEPLGMADTGFAVPPAKRDRLAVCYAPNGQGGLIPVETPFDSGDAPAFLCGGGGLLSTIRDYARFCQMLLNGGELEGVRILAPKNVALMTANASSPAQIPVVPTTWPFRQGYGMALGVRTLVDVPASGAPGSAGTYTWQGAAGTDFWVDPQEQLYGILFTQVLPGMYRPAEDFRTLTYSAMLG
jgi:CubicO group peptidase (beta-lactamase class C family)